MVFCHSSREASKADIITRHIRDLAARYFPNSYFILPAPPYIGDSIFLVVLAGALLLGCCSVSFNGQPLCCRVGPSLTFFTGSMDIYGPWRYPKGCSKPPGKKHTHIFISTLVWGMGPATFPPSILLLSFDRQCCLQHQWDHLLRFQQFSVNRLCLKNWYGVENSSLFHFINYFWNIHGIFFQ